MYRLIRSTTLAFGFLAALAFGVTACGGDDTDGGGGGGGGGTTDSTAPTSSATPVGGTFYNGVDVELRCDDGGGSGCVDVYFTTDGSTPTRTSTVYGSAISLTADTELRFFAVDVAGNQEAANVESYTVVNDDTAPTTVTSPAGGIFGIPVDVTLTCDDGSGSGCGATYYTTDGTDPTTASTAYSAPVHLAADTVLKFFSVDLAGNEESFATESYTVVTSSSCSTTADADSDGLNDCDEVNGWTINVDRDGTGNTIATVVVSDPFTADTDGDGLSDQQEFQSRTDPTRADTDGDGLDDATEQSQWNSDPNDVDSDDDARLTPTSTPNSNLFDGNEVANLGTSPSIPDTDGDVYTDLEEFTGDTNPLVADVPRLELEWVGGLTVQINGTLQSGCSSGSESFNAQLHKDESSSQSSSAAANQFTFDSSVEIHTQVATQTWPPGVSGQLDATATASVGTVQEQSTSFTAESMSTSQREFSNSTTSNCFNETTITGGTVSGGVQINNIGDLTVDISNMNISLIRRDPLQPDGFTVIGQVNVLPSAFALGLGSSTGTLAVSADVSAQLAIQLAKRPTGLMFQVGTYTLSDEDGRDFAFIQQTTLQRTALVEVDFGNGRVERHMVATTVDRQLGGVSLGRALEIIGLPTVTELTDSGYTTMASIDGEAYSEANRQFWFLLGSNAELANPAMNAEEKVLRAGDFMSIVLLKDPDNDLLFDREERIYGCDPTDPDSDGDMMNDREEVDHPRRHPVNPEFPGAFVADVVSTGYHTLALLENGTLWSWGSNTTGQLGRTGRWEIPQMVGSDRDWAVIAAGSGNGNAGVSFAVTLDGRLFGWGSDEYGQMGNGLNSTADVLVPTQIGSASNWVMVEAGANHAFAIDDGDALWAWGMNHNGQLGVTATQTCGGEACSASPVTVPGSWLDVAAGSAHSLGVRTDYTLYSWGDNALGQLGLGDRTDRASPTRIGTTTGWRSVNARWAHSMARLVSGSFPNVYDSLHSWGFNQYGAVGISPQYQAGVSTICGIAPCELEPQVIALPLTCFPVCPSGTTIVDYQAGATAYAINRGGGLSSWGLSSHHDLGRTATDSCMYQIIPSEYYIACEEEPGIVDDTSSWAVVSAHAAITSSGELWVWGRNDDGQLGLGDLTDRPELAQVPEYPLP